MSSVVPNWQHLYNAAILEIQPNLIKSRIVTARNAITTELVKAQAQPDIERFRYCLHMLHLVERYEQELWEAERLALGQPTEQPIGEAA